jgi:pre-mRNA branch site protein p14
MGEFAGRKSHNVSHPSRGARDAHCCLQTFLPVNLIFLHFGQSRLPPEVNRILYVRNLPFTISAEELYAIFGKYGGIHQIRLGNKDKDTKGTAFVVYEDIYDAKAAVDHLSGFNVGGRYLIVLYYQPSKFTKRAEMEEKEKDLQELRKRVQQHKKTIGK